MRKFAVAIVFVLLTGTFLSAADNPTDQDVVRVVEQAAGLLPPSDIPVKIFDPDKVQVNNPEERKFLRAIGGLVIPGERIVRMSSRGKNIGPAVKGDTFALYVLASELAHEYVHAEQFGEREAYAKQVETFQAFIDAGKVDRVAGEKYLSELRRIAESEILREEQRGVQGRLASYRR